MSISCETQNYKSIYQQQYPQNSSSSSSSSSSSESSTNYENTVSWDQYFNNANNNQNQQQQQLNVIQKKENQMPKINKKNGQNQQKFEQQVDYSQKYADDENLPRMTNIQLETQQFDQEKNNNLQLNFKIESELKSYQFPIDKPLKTKFNIQISAFKKNIAVDFLFSKTRPGMDIICIVDKSGSMNRDYKIEFVKQSLIQLIQILGPQDRISIVSYNEQAYRNCKLRCLTQVNKAALINSINKFLVPENQTLIENAIQKTIHIIKHKKHQNDILSVFLLSDGEDNDPQALIKTKNLINSSGITETYTINTFGYGQSHDPVLMKEIASITHSNYYYVENVQDIHKNIISCLTDLLTVAIKNVKITLKVDNCNDTPQIQMNDEQQQQQQQQGCEYNINKTNTIQISNYDQIQNSQLKLQEKVKLEENKNYTIQFNYIMSQMPKNSVVEIEFPAWQGQRIASYFSSKQQQQSSILKTKFGSALLEFQYLNEESNELLNYYMEKELEITYKDSSDLSYNHENELNDEVKIQVLRVETVNVLNQVFNYNEQGQFDKSIMLIQSTIQQIQQYTSLQKDIIIMQLLKDLQQISYISNANQYIKSGKQLIMDSSKTYSDESQRSQSNVYTTTLREQMMNQYSSVQQQLQCLNINSSKQNSQTKNSNQSMEIEQSQ